MATRAENDTIDHRSLSLTHPDLCCRLPIGNDDTQTHWTYWNVKCHGMIELANGMMRS